MAGVAGQSHGDAAAPQQEADLLTAGVLQTQRQQRLRNQTDEDELPAEDQLHWSNGSMEILPYRHLLQ